MQLQLYIMGVHGGLKQLFSELFSQCVNLTDKNTKCERPVLAPSKSKLEKCTLHFFLLGEGKLPFFFNPGF